MIICVRGGCGAGKSTVVRRTMDRACVEKAIYVEGRTKPIGYVLTGGTFVPGHYEIQNGGLDTIGNLERAYELVWHYARAGFHVLYEGMNQRADTERVLGLSREFPTVAVMLVTPYDACLDGFRAKGQKRDEKYVRSTYLKAHRDAERLRSLGVDVRDRDRPGALTETWTLLGL